MKKLHSLELLAIKFGMPQYEECGPIELIVMQGTPFCNIDCSYCYLPNRSSNARMSKHVLEQVASRLAESDLLADSVTVAWHAGEPLVMGIDFYENAIETMRRVLPPHVAITHSFQTNATLIDSCWSEFFIRRNAQVGISVDGPEHIHDRCRKTRAGAGTFARVLAGIEALQTAGHGFHTISLLTDYSLDYAEEIFDFLVALGSRQICFNVDETEGANKISSMAGGAAAQEVEQRYYKFLRTVRGRREKYAQPVFVRELDSVDQAVKSLDPKREWLLLGGQQQTHPFKILNVAVDGSFCTYSPELLGEQVAPYGRFEFGNLLTTTLREAYASPKFKQAYLDIMAGVQACRKECKYFSLCGGGAPANKYFELGSFSGTETEFCRLSRKTAIDEALTALEQLEKATQ